MIYFFQSKLTSLIKIGWTHQDIYQRKNQIQAQYKEKLVILGIVYGGYEEEQKIHHQFRCFSRLDDGGRTTSEWFYNSPELIQYIKDKTITPEIFPREGKKRIN